ncbi:MAG: hypothetical protein DI536_00815 [Archangium gephyra]|uniref:Uncharacterized protein n=1 Tax=Archangium gephyra TaxID=48 RepID=A0A2W5U4A1_9BACT|nr:MAG: hypothetical protein DI536_00815 [Archangium gephyra]
MAETPFQVSALLVTGFKRAATQLGLAEGARSHMSGEVAAMWDEPSTSSWHDGRLFQGMIEALVKVASKEQMSEINFRMGRDQFGPIVGGLINIAVALSSPTPHTVFANMKTIVGVALKGAIVEYEKTGPDSGKFAVSYPLPFPEGTADAWAGVTRYCCSLVKYVAVIDRAENTQNGHRYEVDLHWVPEA